MMRQLKAFVVFLSVVLLLKDNLAANDWDKIDRPITKLSAIASGMSWVGKAVDEPDYYVWCTSPIMGPDGKVNLFCSRWPKEYKFDGWSSHCEIAHYIGDSPEGPFHFVDIAIPSNPDAPFNNSVHNPCISKAGDKYVLMYITFDRTKGGQMVSCMATSDSLNGPWKKEGDDGVVIKPSEDPHHWTYKPWAMDNPTFVAFNGKYYIYFKAAPAGHQFESRYGYAVSDNLEGPYTLSDAPCTDNISYIEDACAFVWDGKVCLMTTDNFGTQTGIEGGGILWKSDDPTQFHIADAEIGFLHPSEYWNLVIDFDLSKSTKLYTSNNVIKFERPGILMINGKPAYFYGACGTNFYGEDHTCSYVMKINITNAKDLALSKPVEVSSSWANRSDLDKSHVTDGDFGSSWATSESSRDGWVQVDLQKVQKVSEVYLGDGPYHRTEAFDVEAQIGDAWQKIAEGTTIGDKLVLTFPPVEARLFRVNIRRASDTPTLSEFQLFEK